MLSIKRRIGQTCPDTEWQATLTRHPRLGARRLFTLPPASADAERVAELTKQVADLQVLVTAQRELVATLATRIGEVITTLGDDQVRADKALDLIGGAANSLATGITTAKSGIFGVHAAAIHALSDAKTVADAAAVVTP